MELGKFFKRKAVEGTRPYFLFTEQGRTGLMANSQELTIDTIERMTHSGQFELARAQVRVSSKLAFSEIILSFGGGDAYPISGFPRSLIDGEKQTRMSSRSNTKQSTHTFHRKKDSSFEFHPMGWWLSSQ